MPGLFGIIAKKSTLSKGNLRTMAIRMADSMRRVPWLRTEIWGDESFCGGRVHLGVLNPESQPTRATDHLVRLWFDGEVYLSSSERGVTPTVEQATTWISHSAAKLAEIDGVFALACFNPIARELTIATDRFGFRPLYYTQTEEWFAYAAEVKALLAICDKLPGVDEIGLRQFFGFGHMLGERTWWKGIEVVPPAVVWRISSNGQTRHRYWSFSDIRREPAPESEVQEEFGRLWSQAIRQRSKPGTMPLLLSGGLDSRLVLAELREQGADVIAITFGNPECGDMRIAQQCAKIAGVRHCRLPLTAENWWQGREDAIWQTDGLVNCLDLHVAIAREEMHVGNCLSLKNLSGDTLFGGSKLGGVASDDWFLHPERLLDHMYNEDRCPLFTRDEVISVSLPDTKHDMVGPSSDCFVFRQRQRRFTLYGALAFASYCDFVNPGVSLPIVQLLLGSLRDEERAESRFYKRFLVKHYPTYYAAVPWQETGRGLAESFRPRASQRIRAIASILRRNGNVTDGAFANYGNFARVDQTQEKLLRQDLLADEFLKGAARRVLVNRKNGPLSPNLLMTIVTFETYLRQVAGMPTLTGVLESSPIKVASR